MGLVEPFDEVLVGLVEPFDEVLVGLVELLDEVLVGLVEPLDEVLVRLGDEEVEVNLHWVQIGEQYSIVMGSLEKYCPYIPHVQVHFICRAAIEGDFIFKKTLFEINFNIKNKDLKLKEEEKRGGLPCCCIAGGDGFRDHLEMKGRSEMITSTLIPG